MLLHNHIYCSYIPAVLLQILNYLGARSNLCELGYDEAQVEEALEMFHNCESKVMAMGLQ